MMHLKASLIVLFTFEILLSACIDNKSSNNGSIISIDIESNIKNFKVIYLSEFVTRVDYIPFENNEDFHFSRAHEFVFKDDLVLIGQITLGAICALYYIAG